MPLSLLYAIPVKFVLLSKLAPARLLTDADAKSDRQSNSDEKSSNDNDAQLPIPSTSRSSSKGVGSTAYGIKQLRQQPKRTTKKASDPSNTGTLSGYTLTKRGGIGSYKYGYK